MKKRTLHKIAPKLSEFSPDDTGFIVPDNYFGYIEDEVLAKIIIEKFKPIQKDSDFETPENYFDKFEDLVLTKLKVEALQNDESSVISEKYFENIEDTILNKIKPKAKAFPIKKGRAKYVAFFAIAASLLLIFILNNNSESLTFDSITTSEIENWIDNGNIDIDALSIASMYTDIELDNDNFSTSLSDNEVLEYLNNEDLDEIIYEN